MRFFCWIALVQLLMWPEVEGRHLSGHLTSGLRYHIQCEPSTKNVRFDLVVKVGTLDESVGEEGFAHLVSKMAFRGGKRFQHWEIIPFIESHAVEFGANAMVRSFLDHTLFTLRLPAQKTSQLKNVIHLLRDWAYDASFPEESVLIEEKIYRREQRAFIGEAHRSESRLRQLTLGKHCPYPSYLSNRTHGPTSFRCALLSFYKKWYQPANMGISVITPHDPEQTRLELERIFSKESSRPVNLERTLKLPEIRYGHVAIEKDPEAPNVRVHLLRIDDLEKTIASSDPLFIVCKSIADELIQFFLNQFRQGTDPCIYEYHTRCRYETFYRLASEVELHAYQAKLIDTVHHMTRLFQTVSQQGCPEELWEWAKQRVLRALTKPSSPASLAEQAVRDICLDSSAPVWREEKSAKKARLENLTLQEFNKWLKPWIQSKMWNYLIVVPASKEFQDLDEKLIKSEILSGLEMVPIEQPSLKVLEHIPASLPLVPCRQVRRWDETGIEEWCVGDNGRWIFIPDKNAHDLKLMGYALGGLASFPAKDNASILMGFPYLYNSGFESLKGSAFHDYLHLNKIGVHFSLHPNYRQVFVTGESHQFENMMDLLYQLFHKRCYEEKMWIKLTGDLWERSRYLQNSPEYLLKFAVNQTLFQNDTVFQSSSIDKANLEIAKRALGSLLDHPSAYLFILAGHFEVSDVVPLIQAYTENGTSRSGASLVEGSTSKLIHPGVKMTLHKGNFGDAEARISFVGDLGHMNPYDLLYYDLRILKHIVRLRLEKEFRNQTGQIASFHVDFEVPYFPSFNPLIFTVHFYAEPQAVHEISQQVQDRIKELTLMPLSLDEIKRATKLIRAADKDEWLQVEKKMQKVFLYQILGFDMDRLNQLPPNPTNRVLQTRIRTVAKKLFEAHPAAIFLRIPSKTPSNPH